MFYEEVLDNKSVITDFNINSNILWVLFGGINGGLGVKIMEFSKITDSIPVKKMFIRDLNYAYYQSGVAGISGVNDVDSCKEFIRLKIKEAQVDKVVFIGNSAGGYASLLFGALLDVDEVHAFSPATLLNTDYLIENANKYFSQVKEKIENKNYFDLKYVFDKTNHNKNYHIYYDVNSMDAFHAERMSDFNIINLHKFSQGGHNVIKELKKKGELKKILEECYERMK